MASTGDVIVDGVVENEAAARTVAEAAAKGRATSAIGSAAMRSVNPDEAAQLLGGDVNAAAAPQGEVKGSGA